MAELFTWFLYRLLESQSCSFMEKNCLVSDLFGCNLFLNFSFTIQFLWESKDNKVGILFINVKYVFLSLKDVVAFLYQFRVALRKRTGKHWNDYFTSICHFPATCMCQAVIDNLGGACKRRVLPPLKSLINILHLDMFRLKHLEFFLYVSIHRETTFDFTVVLA